MAVEFIITPETEQDVDEAYSWYEDSRQGLGEEFLTCVDASKQFVVRLNFTRKSTMGIVVHW